MMALLMHQDRAFDLQRPAPWNEQTLVQDLGLDTLLDAMAAGDVLVRQVAARALLCGEHDAGTIRYRQEILEDCLRRPDAVRRMYALAAGSLEAERKSYYFIFGRSPSSVLFNAVGLLELFAEELRRIRTVAEAESGHFTSRGFTALFAMLKRELSDEFFAALQQHLHEFARAFHDSRMGNAVFLRAERLSDGTRTFRMVEGEPQETSYGEDLYNAVFREAG